MNKKHGLFIGFAVLLLTVMFMAAGCDNPTGGGAGSIVGKWKLAANPNSSVVEFTNNNTVVTANVNSNITYTYDGTTLTLSQGSYSFSGTATITNSGNTLTLGGFPSDTGVNGVYTRQP
jgi:hypothetical protein